MSIEDNSNRDRPILVLGVLVLLMIFSVIGYNLGKDWQQRVHSDQIAQKHANSAEKHVERYCIGIVEALLLLECVNEAKKSANENQRAKYDLDAQQQMARYAFLLFGLTAISTFITGLGVYYVRNTLWETRQANRSAFAAVKQAEESAEITSKMGRLQVQCYLTVTNLQAFDYKPDGKLDIDFVIENTGSSPAYITEYVASFFDLFEDSPELQRSAFVGDITPRTEKKASVRIKGKGKGRAGENCSIRIWVSFTDIFHKKRWVQVCFFRDGERWVLPNEGSVCSESAGMPREKSAAQLAGRREYFGHYRGE